MSEETEDSQPMFRRPKKKPIKTRRNHQIDDGEEDVSSHIEDVKELQKIRERHHGLNALECAVGKDLARVFNDIDENPFNMRGGGMLRLTANKKAALTADEIEHDIKDQFKKETLLRDEHEEMKKYVDQRLKIASDESNPSTSDPETKKFKAETLEDEILFRAAEKLKKFSSTKNDELLSNQMLVGIPEVDLGLSARMNNIVETEQKKLELFRKKKIPNKNAIPEVDLEDPAIKKLRR